MGELERIREARDPRKAFRTHKTTLALLEMSDLDAIDEEISDLIDAAVDEARNAPAPLPEHVLTDVYVSY